MHKLKIIYISYDGMTDPLGQSQVLPYLIGLSKFNIEIHLISFEKKDRFIKKRVDIELLTKNNNIFWYPLRYHQKPPVLSTIYDLWNLKNKAAEIISKNKISIVHCRSYISSLIGLSLKRKNGIPFLFDMRGFWADERIDGKIWNLSNPLFKIIYSFFKRKEKEFICESDYIVSLTDNAKNEILSWNLNCKKDINIQVIPCCADLEHFNSNKLNSKNLKEWQLNLGIEENDFVISYIGSLGTWYMMDEMMDLFKVVIEKIPNCKFLIITADNPAIAYQAAGKLNISKKSIIVTKAERNEVPYLIKLSKFSIFFIKPAYSKKASSPTKLAEILGMGVPVICNDRVGDVESIVEKGNVGFVLKEFNQEAYQAVLEKMMLFLSTSDPNAIANYANTYASLEDGISKYHHVYKHIVNTTNGDTTLL
jgi:glycosyltransferase involved in cell wall biosynthesis